MFFDVLDVDGFVVLLQFIESFLSFGLKLQIFIQLKLLLLYFIQWFCFFELSHELGVVFVNLSHLIKIDLSFDSLHCQVISTFLQIYCRFLSLIDGVSFNLAQCLMSFSVRWIVSVLISFCIVVVFTSLWKFLCNLLEINLAETLLELVLVWLGRGLGEICSLMIVIEVVLRLEY